MAQEQVVSSIDQWITELFDIRKASGQWKPKEEVLKEVEEKIQQYQSVEDAGAVQELLRADYERQRQELVDVKSGREHELKLQNETLKQAKEELEQIQN